MIETPRPSDAITYSMASRDDLPMVRALLSANGLPDEDVGEHIEHFVLAWDEHALLGTAGVELLGNDGLLRSLCVGSSYRNRGRATELYKRVEAYSRNAGLSRLYPLTTTAKEFVGRRGYSVCLRESVPPVVHNTAEFCSLCRSTAVCMVRCLNDGDPADPTNNVVPLS